MIHCKTRTPVGDVLAPVALGLQEMVSLGLIRRRDVHFVERRRFDPAAELERQRESGDAFFEADQSLARSARLRAGGTLGES